MVFYGWRGSKMRHVAEKVSSYCTFGEKLSPVKRDQRSQSATFFMTIAANISSGIDSQLTSCCSSRKELLDVMHLIHLLFLVFSFSAGIRYPRVPTFQWATPVPTRTSFKGSQRCSSSTSPTRRCIRLWAIWTSYIPWNRKKILTELRIIIPEVARNSNDVVMIFVAVGDEAKEEESVSIFVFF
jgi:hypothetical protein